MFYCRDSELEKMNRRYDNGQFECIVIYGRRRVGKTALINEFCKGKPTILFSALDSTEQENLETLSRAVFAYKYPGSDMGARFDTYEDAFNEIGRIASEERLVFVIDEYPYLAKAKSAVSSILQHLIDHRWVHTKLYLILCGSSMSFMENQVLGHESPLYGRRTGQFKIEPLNYRETAVFHPELSEEDNALIYGITGGVPHYINKLGVRGSVDDALLENLFDRSGYLFEEPENLLKQELREPAVYNAVIRAIAEGASRMNEIATKTGTETGPCSKYIHTLMELGIIKKETPVTERPGKKTIYLLADQFFRFWYRFVPKNIIAVASGRIGETYDRAVKAHLADYMGLTFENMCRQYLLYYAEDLPIAMCDLGQWWGTDRKTRRQVQIDIIGCPAEGSEYIIGSCKYKKEKTGLDELERLRSYAAVFGKGSRYHYYIFSKAGFTEGLENAGQRGEVRLVTLEEMYSMKPGPDQQDADQGAG